jgi:hypothetical protein
MTEYTRRTALVATDAVLLSHHARLRMFERNVSTDDLLAVVAFGEVIETYPDDEPCPSALILGFINQVAYHVVVAVCADHLRVVTVYLPDVERWVESRRRREFA